MKGIPQGVLRLRPSFLPHGLTPYPHYPPLQFLLLCPSSGYQHLDGSGGNWNYRFRILSSGPSGSSPFFLMALSKGHFRGALCKVHASYPLNSAFWRWARPRHLSGMNLSHFSDWPWRKVSSPTRPSQTCTSLAAESWRLATALFHAHPVYVADTHDCHSGLQTTVSS